jgi:serine/threonine protein phosphatase 1
MFAQFANFFNTASLPGGTRVYAIGDIHGYPDALETLLEQVHTDIRQAPHVKSQIVFLGDYVNRGPDTPKVLSALISEKKMQKLDGVERHFLVGNHDLWFGGFLANDNVRFHGTINFLCNGGARALENYGVSISQEASRVKTVFFPVSPISRFPIEFITLKP